MRIVQIVTQMEAGGAQRVAVLLASGLRRLGHEVEVWFLYVKRPSYEDAAGIRSLLGRPPKLLDYPWILWRLWRDLHSYRPDVVITHTHYANIIGQFLSWLAGVRNRIAVQHSLVDTYPIPARVCDKLLGSSGFYTANVAVSHAVKDSLACYPNSYRQRLKVIPNGLPQLPPIGRTREELRLQWGIPLDAPVVVNVGRLAGVKNQGLILEVLRLVPDVHLVLVGDGENRQLLEQQARSLSVADRVRFLGEIPSPDVNGVLRAADIFVFPSLSESMGLALVEAMLAQLPIIASDIPALRDVVGEGALLANPDDANEWAESIRALLASRELRCDLARRAFAIAQDFSFERMVGRYAELIEC